MRPRKRPDGSHVTVPCWTSERMKTANRSLSAEKHGLFRRQCAAHCALETRDVVFRGARMTDMWMGITSGTGLTAVKRVSTTLSCYAGTTITSYTKVVSPVRRPKTAKSCSKISDRSRCRPGPRYRLSTITRSMNGLTVSFSNRASIPIPVPQGGMRVIEWTGLWRSGICFSRCAPDLSLRVVLGV